MHHVLKSAFPPLRTFLSVRFASTGLSDSAHVQPYSAALDFAP